MSRIARRLPHHVKRQVRRIRSKARDRGLYARCQIVLLADRGRTRADVAESVGCSVSWVDRVLARFRADGAAGLFDRRADNGTVKLDEAFLAQLYALVDGSPRDHGFPRPTWTRELLCRVMLRLTDVAVHPATMSRALALIGARLGRPKPTVGCPWPAGRKNRRLAAIRRTLATLPAGHVAVHLDEVDVHLNPKVGPDWMNRGTQKEVVTPGTNAKRYLCGAQDATSGVLAWVAGERKDSVLFVRTLHRLATVVYPGRTVHVVLDNFRIHDSRAARAAVESLAGRVVLHFLPPYCPDHNRIERTWRDLHDNVTRNHTCRDMGGLMAEVTAYLHARNRRKRAAFRRGRVR